MRGNPPRRALNAILRNQTVKKVLSPLCLAIVLIISSCAMTPLVWEIPRPPQPEAAASMAAQPELIPIPPIPYEIMGKGLISPEDLAAFLMQSNPGADPDYVEALALIYAEEAAIEGINHDVAFAQMSLETGYLRFGGLVTPEMNNFAGLGSIGPGQHGLLFPDPRTGVRAHIQHLKAYASEAPLNQLLVNPRYHYVRLGSSPTISGLAGTWAADPDYGVKINNILERLYRFSFES
ncbi:MAG: glucosaminidase domain-containing protein [Treponema sp.]|nr:glucosaminidase domain-containing protein [Treponema sp.]